MKKAYKELLQKDLLARLSCGVICYTERVEFDELAGCNTIVKSDEAITSYYCGRLYGDMYDYEIENVKPYLRHPSSMTTEERETLRHLKGFNSYDLDKSFFLGESDVFDYLNSIHVAYRTLNGKDMFELGLAIKVTKENNPYK